MVDSVDQLDGLIIVNMLLVRAKPLDDCVYDVLLDAEDGVVAQILNGLDIFGVLSKAFELGDEGVDFANIPADLLFLQLNPQLPERHGYHAILLIV